MSCTYPQPCEHHGPLCVHTHATHVLQTSRLREKEGREIERNTGKERTANSGLDRISRKGGVIVSGPALLLAVLASPPSPTARPLLRITLTTSEAGHRGAKGGNKTVLARRKHNAILCYQGIRRAKTLLSCFISTSFKARSPLDSHTDETLRYDFQFWQISCILL